MNNVTFSSSHQDNDNWQSCSCELCPLTPPTKHTQKHTQTHTFSICLIPCPGSSGSSSDGKTEGFFLRSHGVPPLPPRHHFSVSPLSVFLWSGDHTDVPDHIQASLAVMSTFRTECTLTICQRLKAVWLSPRTNFWARQGPQEPKLRLLS